MKIYACMKQVPDTEAKIEIKEKTLINESNIKWIVNPYCEYGMEEAIRLKEKIGGDAEVISVCLGPQRAAESIRTTLAMGADRALHIVEDRAMDHHTIAKALGQAIQNDGEPTAIFSGIMASDDTASQVPLRLAQTLGCAVATNVTAFELDGTIVKVSREIDEGAQEKLELKIPAVVSVNKAINTPRYPTLPNIMKAKKKEIKSMTLTDLGISEIGKNEELLEYLLPAEKSAGKIVAGENNPDKAVELVNLLKNEAKVV